MTSGKYIFTVLAACAGSLGLMAVPAHAQSLSMEGSKGPIDVTAEKGFEVQTDNKRVIARGNAKAVQGEVSILGDELTADYRTRADGSEEVYRVFASGNVTMKSASETASGDTAIYDFDKAVLVLEGGEVKLVNAEGSVTANRFLQYWSNDRVAVAEGAAVAVDKDKRRLSADKLIAFFRDSEGAPASAPSSAKRSRGDITYIQAFNNVRLETAKEIVRGDRGAYNIESGIATLDGSVKITQNKSQASAGFAVVNVKGGTSRLFPSAKEAGMQSVKENTRVKALIAPAAKAGKPAPAPAAGAAAGKGPQ